MNALRNQSKCVYQTEIVPFSDSLTDLKTDGQRLLACRGGLWLEVRRRWLHARLPILPISIPLSYGMPQATIDFSFGHGLLDLLCLFVHESQIAFPMGHAAWLIWNDVEKRLEYESLRLPYRANDQVTTHQPREQAGWHPCVNLCSPGQFAAGFSAMDAMDDGQVTLAIVIGNCDGSMPSISARLYLPGIHHDMSLWAEQLLYPSLRQAGSGSA